MNTKRVFKGNLKSQIVFLPIFWAIIHSIGWYANEFNGFLTKYLIFLSLGITILILMLLSNSGSSKGGANIELPCINSYKKGKHSLFVSPGGFNFFIRIFYLLIAGSLISLSFYFEPTDSNENNYLGITLFLIYLISIIFSVSNYIKNRNDSILITEKTISWFDNDNKNTVAINLSDIKSFEIETNDDSKYPYPIGIILKTQSENYSINLKSMSILQFAHEIIGQLKENLESL